MFAPKVSVLDKWGGEDKRKEKEKDKRKRKKSRFFQFFCFFRKIAGFSLRVDSAPIKNRSKAFRSGIALGGGSSFPGVCAPLGRRILVPWFWDPPSLEASSEDVPDVRKTQRRTF